jgi:hypothetical protein
LHSGIPAKEGFWELLIQPLVMAKLCPSLDKPLLPLRNRSGYECDRGDGERCDMLLIICMKMCAVMAL